MLRDHWINGILLGLCIGCYLGFLGQMLGPLWHAALGIGAVASVLMARCRWQ